MSNTSGIQLGDFPDLDWSDGKRAGSLGKLFGYVANAAQKAGDWYSENRPRVKVKAWVLRMAAILLTGAGGLAPLISKLTESNNGAWFDPLWSGILLGTAGILVLLDRFFGFTSAWTRYMKAEQQIEQGRVLFGMDYVQEQVSWGDSDPTVEQTLACLKVMRQAILGVLQIVQFETGEWVAEFRQVVKQIDASTKKVEPNNAPKE